MQFQMLQVQVMNYLHVKGAEAVDQIKSSINESVLDLIREKEWAKCKVVGSFPIDGSNSYSLDNSIMTPNITDQFEGEIDLFNGSGAKYQKIDYETYLAYSNKTGFFAVFGDVLYVTGDNDTVTLMYVTAGTNFPMTDDDHEVPATKYYWDIIKKMAVISFLDYIGDAEMVVKEEANLSRKIDKLRRSENRIKNNGKLHHVRRG